MGFNAPEQDEFELTGYVSTYAFNAQGIAEDFGRAIESEWVVNDRPVSSYGGGDSNFKITIKVERA